MYDELSDQRCMYIQALPNFVCYYFIRQSLGGQNLFTLLTYK